MTLVDANTFGERLTHAGFEDVRVDCQPSVFKFVARRP